MSETNALSKQEEKAVRAEERRIRMTQLDNGCWVVTRRDASLSKTSCCCLMRSGPIDEVLSGYPRGTAHLLEHLLFRGNHNVDPTGLPYKKYLRSCSFHELMRTPTFGETGPLRTLYFFEEGGRNDWRLLLRALAEPRFTKQDIACEKRRVRMEYKSSLIDDFLDGHKIQRPQDESSDLLSILGTVAALSSIKQSDLLSFHATHYVANRMIFAMEGPVHHDQAVDQIAGHLALPRGAEAARPVLPSSLADDDERTSKWSKAPGLATFSVQMPITGEPEKRNIYQWAFDQVAGLDTSAPFMLKSVVNKGLAYALQAEMVAHCTGEYSYRLETSLEPKCCAPFLQDWGRELGAQASSMRTKKGAMRWASLVKKSRQEYTESLGFPVSASLLAEEVADKLDAHETPVIDNRSFLTDVSSLSSNEIADMIERVRASRPTFRALGAIKGLPAPDQIPLLLNPR